MAEFLGAFAVVGGLVAFGFLSAAVMKLARAIELAAMEREVAYA